jgi:hypothetical protein
MGGTAVRNWARVVFLATAAAGVVASSGAFGQYIRGQATIALRSGESAELTKLYYVENCRSMLKSTPEAEIIDAPPAVTVSVREDMVLPRAQGCAKPVKGGTLVISAKDIEDLSYTPVTIRVTYKTHDGDRKLSYVINLSLIP